MDLVSPLYNFNKCQGWTNPNNMAFGPKIDTLSSFYCPAGSTTLVSINGENFYTYSSISFGNYFPTVYFINSNILQFYVPSTLNYGTYTVQVFNGSFPSNCVNFTIDNASGYWLMQPSGAITNTNTTGMIEPQSLSRGAPISIDETTPTYTVPNNVNWIICYNENVSTNFIIQLPQTSYFVGREIMIKSVYVANNEIITTSPTIYSAQKNIVPFDSVSPINSINGAIDNVIITGKQQATKWVTLVYDGNYWLITQTN
jgi:hypothetical protein